MNHKKPVIVRSVTTPACPVCGKPSYSANGMHPQCGMVHADAMSKADRTAQASELSKSTPKLWRKLCPKCKRDIPARRVVCDCGHTFASMTPAAAN